MNRRGWLQGTGWVTWEEVREIVGDAQCVWSDLEGVHVREVPDVPPLATHLWAWDAQAWYRVRIDDGEAVVATLRTDQPSPELKAATMREYDASTWAEQHVKTGDSEGIRWAVAEGGDGAGFVFLSPAEVGAD